MSSPIVGIVGGQTRTGTCWHGSLTRAGPKAALLGNMPLARRHPCSTRQAAGGSCTQPQKLSLGYERVGIAKDRNGRLGAGPETTQGRTVPFGSTSVWQGYRRRGLVPPVATFWLNFSLAWPKNAAAASRVVSFNWGAIRRKVSALHCKVGLTSIAFVVRPRVL